VAVPQGAVSQWVKEARGGAERGGPTWGILDGVWQQ
jgi:hypothetical protein